MLSEERLKQQRDTGTARTPLAIILGGGRDQIPLIQAAHRRSWETLVIDRDSSVEGAEEASYFLQQSLFNTHGVLQQVETLAANYRVAAVLARTSAEKALRTSVALSDRYSVPGLDNRILSLATNKRLLRKFCQKRGIPVPTGWRGGSLPESAFPIIVKPESTIRGKKGIYFCLDNDRFQKVYRECRKLSANGKAEVQEFIPGLDSTCFCVLDRGQARPFLWWDELVGIDEHGVIQGLGVSLPSRVEATPLRLRAEEIMATMARFFPALRYPLLFSFRADLTSHRISLIEMHADLGGDLIADYLIPGSTGGWNFFDFVLQVLSGEPIADRTPILQGATLLYTDSSVRIVKGTDPDHIRPVLDRVLRERNLKLSQYPEGF